jgi:hypothetical protein
LIANGAVALIGGRGGRVDGGVKVDTNRKVNTKVRAKRALVDVGVAGRRRGHDPRIARVFHAPSSFFDDGIPRLAEAEIPAVSVTAFGEIHS